MGAASERTVQALGTINCQVGERVFLSAGYRHLEVDYRSGGARFDMRMGSTLRPSASDVASARRRA